MCAVQNQLSCNVPAYQHIPKKWQPAYILHTSPDMAQYSAICYIKKAKSSEDDKKHTSCGYIACTDAFHSALQLQWCIGVFLKLCWTAEPTMTSIRILQFGSLISHDPGCDYAGLCLSWTLSILATCGTGSQ